MPETFMVVEVQPTVYGDTIHIPGFKRIQEVECDERSNTVRLVIRYDNTSVEVHKLRIGMGGDEFNGYWELGVKRLRDGHQILYYEHKVYRNGTWMAVDPPAA
ncbi:MULTISPECIES: hypothetical protein [unclassified Nocardia]|uniref:hypothetical protein n=1 Tax=unclassified Nocardia TaxID=2637762 RepID=UPI0010758387|nr:hypothetical protein [Nocardia sp. CS682]QBS41989.1 hypothetical protein DMB37_19465 [Nocardia sp. CS682]